MKKTFSFGFLIIMASFLWTQSLAGRRQSQAEMNMEANQNFQKADKELNLAYSKLSKALEVKRRAKLKEAQRAWLKFRDAESAFWASEMEGGSAYPMLYSGTMANLTKKRAKELKEAYGAVGER